VGRGGRRWFEKEGLRAHREQGRRRAGRTRLEAPATRRAACADRARRTGREARRRRRGARLRRGAQTRKMGNRRHYWELCCLWPAARRRPRSALRCGAARSRPCRYGAGRCEQAAQGGEAGIRLGAHRACVRAARCRPVREAPRDAAALRRARPRGETRNSGARCRPLACEGKRPHRLSPPRWAAHASAQRRARDRARAAAYKPAQHHPAQTAKRHEPQAARNLARKAHARPNAAF
jgi:hypothetical protein